VSVTVLCLCVVVCFSVLVICKLLVICKVFYVCACCLQCMSVLKCLFSVFVCLVDDDCVEKHSLAFTGKVLRPYR